MKPKLRFPEFSGEWKEVRLGDISICEDYKRIPLNEQERKEKKGIYPYWGSTKIMDYINDYIFDGEYVLLSEDGGYFYDYKEKPIAFYVNGKFWANNHIHVLKIINHNTKFIYYSLVHKNILAYITGGTRSKLNQKDLKQIKIYLPPTIKEQEKIAEFLSSIDKKIEIVTKKIEELKKYKKGLLQKMLNVTDGEPKIRFKEFSGKWKEVKLGEVGDTYSGLTNKNKEHFNQGNAYFIPFMNVMNNVIIDTSYLEKVVIYSNENQNQVKKGDILFTTSSETPNEVGMCSVYLDNKKVYLNSFCFGLRLKNYDIDSLFLTYLLRYRRDIFYKIAQGATRYNLSKKHFNGIKIHIPPTFKEQEKIASFLSSIDKKIEIENKVLENLKKYKKGLLQKMFV